MITFDEAKAHLKELLHEVGFTLTDEHVKEIFFEQKSNKMKIKATEEDIIEFQKAYATLPSLKLSPVKRL